MRSLLFGEEKEIKYQVLNFDPVLRYRFYPPIKLEINIPIKNQETTKLVKRVIGDRVEASSHFTVFYDGCNYIITTKVKDIDKFHSVSPDVRDFLINLLNENFKMEMIPPSPMRECYYLLFLSDISLREEIEKYLKRFLPNKYFIFKEEKKRKMKNKILSTLLIRSQSFLGVFYAVQ